MANFKISKKMNTSKKISVFALSLLLGLLGMGQSSYAAGEKHLQAPKRLPANCMKRHAAKFESDILLVMPQANADKEEIADILKETHGTVIGSIGEGRLKCLIVKTEKGKLAETEKTLTKDKHFADVQRNYVAVADFVPNDPQFPGEWHLPAINAPKAWDTTTGTGASIAVLDSGCQRSIPDLLGKTQRGYDATALTSSATTLFGNNPLGKAVSRASETVDKGGDSDFHGHGTWVATTAAASANNMQVSAGVAPDATIYPICIARPNGDSATTDDIAIMSAIINAEAHGIKILNISYGGLPPFNFNNRAAHPALHEYFKHYHDEFGGLIFMSAGNDALFDPVDRVPYLNMVSAVDRSLQLADFGNGKGSNFGNCIEFAAPGKDIVCSGTDGMPISVSGTSFSSPIVASIAALVWRANSSLTNQRVINIMRNSCFTTNSGGWNQFFGFGMPNAERAVRMARGLE